MELNRIYNENCLEGMKRIPDNSVDMILCDLPYGTTACKWDSILPFDLMWEQYKRIVRKNAAIVLTASQPFTTSLICSNYNDFRYAWVWIKNAAGGFAQAKNKPMPKHEDVLVFSTGRTGHATQCPNRVPYNPQGLVHLGRVVKNSRANRATAFEFRENAKESYIQEFTGYPSSILQFDCERRGVHPTQKPVALFEYLVRTYTNLGETVLDNCMGSGTTAVACINSGRNFIGFETDRMYYDASLSRISGVLSKPLTTSAGGEEAA